MYNILYLINNKFIIIIINKNIIVILNYKKYFNY